MWDIWRKYSVYILIRSIVMTWLNCLGHNMSNDPEQCSSYHVAGVAGLTLAVISICLACQQCQPRAESITSNTRLRHETRRHFDRWTLDYWTCTEWIYMYVIWVELGNWHPNSTKPPNRAMLCSWVSLIIRFSVCKCACKERILQGIT